MRRLLWIAVPVVVAFAVGVIAYQFGYLQLTYPGSDYPVRGIDVSEHQGRIDWAAVARSRVAFAYMKATEGATYSDDRFDANWRAAGKAGVARGAYHFFTFCSDPNRQAASFLKKLSPSDDQLPPAVDVEFVGNCHDPPSDAVIRSRLRSFLAEIERHIGRRPVVYTTSVPFYRLVRGHLERYPLWARGIIGGQPGDRWTFWQYAGNGRVPGVKGHADLDVFAGSWKAFRSAIRGGPGPRGRSSRG